MIVHEQNGGVGAAIVTGYQRALAEEIDVTCVMAADNQMDPAELADARRAGRARRGRLREGEPARHRRGVAADPAHALPRQRRPLAADEDRLGLLARRRLAGRLHRDLARDAAQLDLDRDLPRYGFPNDMLVHLNVWNARVRDVPSRPDLRRRRALGDQDPQGRAADLLAARQGLLLAAAGEVRDPRLPPARLLLRARAPDDGRRASLLGAIEVVLRFVGNEITTPTIVLVALLLISGSQFTLFAMWFDMESNKELR